MTVTTIPPRCPGLPDDPDGHSEWIVLEETKNKFLEDVAGYPKPVPKPVGHPPYVVAPTPKMGMGVFATRDIRVGELIFAERPLCVGPRQSGYYCTEKYLDSDPKTRQAIELFEMERQLEHMLDRMTPEDQIVFNSLTNSHEEDGSGPLFGIARTNAYGITEIIDEGVSTDQNHYCAVQKVGSRINHSCMPNVTQEFCVDSFSSKILATGRIKAGEQLFYSYCSINKSAAERRAQLAPYGFVCDCPACTNATHETDNLRLHYKDMTWSCLPMTIRSIISENDVAESALFPVLMLREVMEREGLQAAQEYAFLVACIYKFYARFGMREKAALYVDDYLGYKSLFSPSGCP